MTGMVRPRRSRRAALVTVVSLAALAALASCSRRVAAPDASYSSPEGAPSDSATLVVWADESNPVFIFEDRAPLDADPGDRLISVSQRRRGSPGTVNGMIFDGTNATDYQVFRREASGGVRRLGDFNARRTQRWLDSGWEAYFFSDANPKTPMTYIARGLVGGVANDRSPLTPAARASLTPVDDIGLRAVWLPPQRGVKLTWNDVPGAARYWLQIYTFRSDLRSTDERILSGTPSPLYDGQSHNIFVGSLPAPMNFFVAGFNSVADTAQTHARIFNIRAPEFLRISRIGDRSDTTAARQPFRVRLTAVDASGRVLATSRGTDNMLSAWIRGEAALQRGIAGTGTYGIYRLNSAEALDTTVVALQAQPLEMRSLLATSSSQAGRTGRH